MRHSYLFSITSSFLNSSHINISLTLRYGFRKKRKRISFHLFFFTDFSTITLSILYSCYYHIVGYFQSHQVFKIAPNQNYLNLIKHTFFFFSDKFFQIFFLFSKNDSTYAPFLCALFLNIYTILHRNKHFIATKRHNNSPNYYKRKMMLNELVLKFD